MTTSKTTLHPYPHRPVLVRAGEAERLDSIGHVLLADSSTTGGAPPGTAPAHSAVSYPEPLTAAQKNHAALLDLGVFEPWFLIQGLLLLLAGRWFARTAAGRRRWTLSLIAGVVLADAFGIALAVAHKHFAVS